MPKKRRESAFGIHFDFHAMPSQVVAEDFRPDLIAKLLIAVFVVIFNFVASKLVIFRKKGEKDA